MTTIRKNDKVLSMNKAKRKTFVEKKEQILKFIIANAPVTSLEVHDFARKKVNASGAYSIVKQLVTENKIIKLPNFADMKGHVYFPAETSLEVCQEELIKEEA